jgi:hypothetical protein
MFNPRLLQILNIERDKRREFSAINHIFHSVQLGIVFSAQYLARSSLLVGSFAYY